MKTFSKIFSMAAISFVTAFAQDPQEPASTADVQPNAPAAVSSSSEAVSSSSDTAFDDFMNSTYDNGVSSSSAATVDTTDAESSSSGEGGIVLIGDDDDTPAKRPVRRVYSRDAPIYKYQFTAGLRSPSRGIASAEYIVAMELLNVGIHFTDANSDMFQFGAALQYYPMEMRYFYMFLSSDWVHGEYERERDLGKGEYEDYNETINFWRVVVGIGGEALFLEHFGMYVELGFEFFAGNGSYYLHMSKKHGTLSNDTFTLPYGIGVLIPF